MSFPISPGVNVREIDLTTGTPVISTSIGAMCGQFTWGPVDERTLVVSEVDLRNNFQKPNDSNFAQHLAKLADLYVNDAFSCSPTVTTSVLFV